MISGLYETGLVAIDLAELTSNTSIECAVPRWADHAVREMFSLVPRLLYRRVWSGTRLTKPLRLAWAYQRGYACTCTC